MENLFGFLPWVNLNICKIQDTEGEHWTGNNHVPNASRGGSKPLSYLMLVSLEMAATKVTQASDGGLEHILNVQATDVTDMSSCTFWIYSGLDASLH